MSEPDRHAGIGKKRVVAEALIAIAVGSTIALRFRWHLGIAVCCVGVFVLISGFFVPEAYRAFKRLGHLFGRAVGVGMAWVLLVPFFYVCFTAGRLVLLLTGKDPLCRKFPTKLDTYWVPHHPGRGPASYRRQY